MLPKTANAIAQPMEMTDSNEPTDGDTTGASAEEWLVNQDEDLFVIVANINRRQYDSNNRQIRDRPPVTSLSEITTGRSNCDLLKGVRT